MNKKSPGEDKMQNEIWKNSTEEIKYIIKDIINEA